MYRLCIFDLDGTLADTIESMAYPANRALSELGLPELASEGFRYYAGDGAAVLCRRCLAAAGDPEGKHYEAFYPLYLKYFGQDCMYQVHPYEGICRTLGRLKDAGIPIAVLSNKPHGQAVHVIESLFGEGYFNAVQGQADGLPKKPAPDGALRLAERFEAKPEECLYVGDTGTDMLTGSRAGMHTVGVLWGFRTREELQENGADQIIDRPEQLLEIAGIRRAEEGNQ
ncbi:MAG: HAD family hydrolase [Candidatus Limivivens sp.]|nr:HAD family hydrolase [Candidatus Limivivens sp.]